MTRSLAFLVIAPALFITACQKSNTPAPLKPQTGQTINIHPDSIPTTIMLPTDVYFDKTNSITMQVAYDSSKNDLLFWGNLIYQYELNPCQEHQILSAGNYSFSSGWLNYNSSNTYRSGNYTLYDTAWLYYPPITYTSNIFTLVLRNDSLIISGYDCSNFVEFYFNGKKQSSTLTEFPL